jgi:hypothetical protein
VLAERAGLQIVAVERGPTTAYTFAPLALDDHALDDHVLDDHVLDDRAVDGFGASRGT